MFLIVQLGGFQTSSFETINDKLPLLPILISWGIKRGRNIPYTSGRLEAELLQWLGAFKAVIDKAQTADAAMGASVSKTVAELPGYLYSEDVLWNFKNRNEITVVFEFPPTAEQKARELSAQVVPFDLRAGVLNLKWVLRQFLGPDQSSFLANISFHPEISTISVTISLKGPEETGVLAEKKTPPGTLSAAGEVLVDKSMTAIPKGQAYRIADLVMNDIQLVKKEDMWWWNNKYGRDMQSFTTTYLSPQLGELALTYYTTINSGWSNVELSMKGRTYNYTWNPHADLSHTWQSGVGNSKDPGDIDTNAQLKKIIGELLLWRGISEQEVIQFAAVIATQEKGHSNAAMLSPALGGAVLARMQKVMEELVGQQKPDWLQSAEITPNYRFELKVGGQEQWGFVGVDSFGGGGRNIRVYWRSVLGAGSVHNFRPDQQDEILKQTEEDMRLVFRNARAHAAWEQAQKLDRETAQPAQGFGALMTTVSLASVKKAIGDFMEARYDFYRKLSDDVRPNFRFPSPALVFYNGVKIFRNSNISNFSAAAAQDAFARLSKGPDRKYSYEVSENGVSIFDAAMASAVTPLAVQKTSVVAFPGGIDLNTSSGMQWKLSKDGRGVEMNVDPAMIERVRREGIDSLSPVIFKITPVASVWPLVGLAAPR